MALSTNTLTGDEDSLHHMDMRVTMKVDTRRDRTVDVGTKSDTDRKISGIEMCTPVLRDVSRNTARKLTPMRSMTIRINMVGRNVSMQIDMIASETEIMAMIRDVRIVDPSREYHHRYLIGPPRQPKLQHCRSLINIISCLISALYQYRVRPKVVEGHIRCRCIISINTHFPRYRGWCKARDKGVYRYLLQHH
jgi:hypothetical protein